MLAAMLPLMAADSKAIVLLGPPGSGQTTQAKALQKRLRLPVVSVDDLIAAEAGTKSEEGRLLRAALESGAIQRLDTVNDLVRQRLSQSDVRGGFILDGYPRTWKQAEAFEKMVAEFSLPAPRIVILEVSDEEAKRRMKKRGGQQDEPAKMDERLAAFHKEIDAVTAHFAGRMVAVNGEQPPAKVTSDILNALEARK
jgi:adenylate kinase